MWFFFEPRNVGRFTLRVHNLFLIGEMQSFPGRKDSVENASFFVGAVLSSHTSVKYKLYGFAFPRLPSLQLFFSG